MAGELPEDNVIGINNVPVSFNSRFWTGTHTVLIDTHDSVYVCDFTYTG